MRIPFLRAKRPILLLAEDDEDWAYLFRIEFLKLAPNWELDRVAEGLAAQSYLLRAPLPRGLVTDIHMPRVSGLELLEWMKLRPRFDLLPTIVLSSSENPSNQKRCSTLGVGGYLNKTGSLKLLRSHIHDILRLCEKAARQERDHQEEQ